MGQQIFYRDVLHKEWRKGTDVGKEGEKVYRIKNRDNQAEVRKIVNQVVPNHESEGKVN